MQPQNLLLIYKNVKKTRFQPQKMLFISVLLFQQCSQNSTMFFRVVTIHFFLNSTSKFVPHLQKCKENEVSTSKNAPNLYLTLSTVFLQLHHVCGVVTIHNLKKNMQPQNLLLIYKIVKKMRFQPQKMLLICILLFLQCSHNFTMFVGWKPYIIFF